MIYKLVRGPNLRTLEYNVQETCGQGWQPTGGPTYSAASNEWTQAVWRAGAPPEPDKLKLKEKHEPDRRR
jgi:hypothetical protein